MTTASDQVVEIRPSLISRGFSLGVGAVGIVAFGWWAVQESPLCLVFVGCAAMVGLEGLRSKVVVDLARGTVTSTRAVRTTYLTIAEIEAVWVPRKGPIVLLRSAGGGRVGTGLYANRDLRGGETSHDQLARLLDVEVISVRRYIRSTNRTPLPQVSFALHTREGALTWLLAALVLGLVGVLVVGAMAG